MEGIGREDGWYLVVRAMILLTPPHLRSILVPTPPQSCYVLVPVCV